VSTGRRLIYTALGAFVPLMLVVLIYAGYALSGTLIVAPHTSGTIGGLSLGASAKILRDERGVPYIRADTAHDAAFAQGYATGSDRLFQIDITRRFVLGTLSELLGGTTLDADENARVVDIRSIVEREYAHLTPADHDELQAYADGVNAAAEHEPQAPEYRALVAGFTPWKPQDSLAVGFAVVLDLTDSWYDVIVRDTVEQEVGPRADAAFYSLTDPGDPYTTVGGPYVAVPPLPALDGARSFAPVAWNGDNVHDVLGSNEWVAGAQRSATGRAILANDPHLQRRIPGIWHLVDVAYPGSHIAGAAIAGVPGVVLGHNATLAWGATYADAVSPRVYSEDFTSDQGLTYRAGAQQLAATVRHETFSVRFDPHPHTRDYLSTRHGFVLEVSGMTRHAVQWEPFESDTSAIDAFLALDRAPTLEAGLAALATYPGPTQNFALAQTDGRVAYTVAGDIPTDPGWGRHVVDGAATSPQALQFVPFSQLPHTAPSRSAILVNANNVPYAAGYPFRLSAAYSPPYRAAEIAARLRAQPLVGIDESRSIQADTLSRAEGGLARLCVTALHAAGADRDPDIAPAYGALAAFDGHFDPTSQGATVVQRIRVIATRDLIAAHMSAGTAGDYLRTGPAFVTLMRALREHPRGWFPHDDPAAFLVAAVRETVKAFGGKDVVMTPYGQAYSVVAQHPFGSLGFHLWDAPPFTGSGGSYAPAVQGITLGQSFRAVWDVGNWDAGGIDLPLGESGEPGAPHYIDGAGPWQRRQLTPLPYSDGAVAQATRTTLTLAP
jgi:penicillin amidase